MKAGDIEYDIENILVKDGARFCELYDMLDCQYTREKLRKLVDFDVSIGCRRNDIVNTMINYQVDRIIKK